MHTQTAERWGRYRYPHEEKRNDRTLTNHELVTSFLPMNQADQWFKEKIVRLERTDFHMLSKSEVAPVILGDNDYKYSFRTPSSSYKSRSTSAQAKGSGNTSHQDFALTWPSTGRQTLLYYTGPLLLYGHPPPSSFDHLYMKLRPSSQSMPRDLSNTFAVGEEKYKVMHLSLWSPQHLLSRVRPQRDSKNVSFTKEVVYW